MNEQAGSFLLYTDAGKAHLLSDLDHGIGLIVRDREVRRSAGRMRSSSPALAHAVVVLRAAISTANDQWKPASVAQFVKFG